MAGFIQLGRMEEHIRYGEEEIGGGWGTEKENGTCLASCSPTMIFFSLQWDTIISYNIFPLQCMYPYYCNLEKARKWATSLKPCLYP